MILSIIVFQSIGTLGLGVSTIFTSLLASGAFPKIIQFKFPSAPSLPYFEIYGILIPGDGWPLEVG